MQERSWGVAGALQVPEVPGGAQWREAAVPRLLQSCEHPAGSPSRPLRAGSATHVSSVLPVQPSSSAVTAHSHGDE